jgi:predicted RND superfamily exporter protein
LGSCAAITAGCRRIDLDQGPDTLDRALWTSMASYFTWIVNRPWWTILFCLSLTALVALGVPRLGVNSAYEVYFAPDNLEWQSYKAIEQVFGHSDSLLIALAPADGDVFSPDTLDAVRTATDAVWRIPYVSRVDSLTNYHQATTRDDEMVVEPLVPAGRLSAGELADIRRRALDDSRIAGGLVATDAAVTGIFVDFSFPDTEEKAATRRAAREVQALAAELQSDYPGLRIYLTGLIMLNQALLESIRWELSHLYPAALIVIFAILALFFRGIAAAGVTLAVLVMASGAGFGAAGWTGLTLNTASASAVIVILTLAVADCVHILVSFGNACGNGYGKRRAMLDSLRINARPVLLTSLTTAVGFLGLNFSESPPFRDLGNIAAVGVIAAWLFAMSFLPAATMLLPPPKARAGGISRALLSRLAEIVIARRRVLLLGGGVTVVVLASAIPLNRFGDNYMEFFDRPIEFSAHTNFVNHELTGLQLMEYPIEAGGAGEVQNPEFLENLDRLAVWFRAQPEVRRVVSVTDLVKRLNQSMHNGDPEYYRIPESRSLVAQYLLFYEMSLPESNGITDLVNMDKSTVRLGVLLGSIPDQQMVVLDRRAQAWIQEHWAEEKVVAGSGISVMFASIARRNFGSMLKGTGLAFAFIALIMLWMFRSLRMGLLSVVPNLAPMLMGFGVWGLTVGQTGVSTSVVASLTLGIVVDDSIHMLAKYRLARTEKGLSPADAVRDAFAHVGVALLLTTLVLITGFLLLLLSPFIMTAHLGGLTAIIIALALATDFLLLPPLLLAFDRAPSGRI